MSARRTEAGAVGLVLARPLRMLSAEPFFMEFISGIEERLSTQGRAVLLHMVTTHKEEIATYRRWAEQGLVDAVAVVNLTDGDRRPAVLRELGLPAVLVGTWTGEPALPTVATDDTSPVHEALNRLFDLGHRRIARVSGPSALLHTRARTAALSEGTREAGVDPPLLLEGDYSHESGERLTVELLSRTEPPTAILYDNDVMAVAGLSAARKLDVPVPDRVSLIAWDDSVLCQLSSPPITAMSVDVHQQGVLVAETALESMKAGSVTERCSPTARFVRRGSTGPAPGRK